MEEERGRGDLDFGVCVKSSAEKKRKKCSYFYLSFFNQINMFCLCKYYSLTKFHVSGCIVVVVAAAVVCNRCGCDSSVVENTEKLMVLFFPRLFS